MAALVECVPNFSEGRDRRCVDSIAARIGARKDAWVLDVTMDADHNRSVITFAGAPEAVLAAAVDAAGDAVARIDLNRHSGVHPRIGAIDVLPFVPIREVSMADCVELAVRAGEAIWSRFRVPSYLYEFAARSEDRRNLAGIRKGQFEGMRSRACPPDIGGPEPHPTAGAVAIGARKVLIAFNVNLAGADLPVAKEVARRVRTSSGGLPCVKALGLALETAGLVQVSMNLTDYEVTPVRVAFDAVAREARLLGALVAESELIGLAPRAALDPATAAHVRLRDFHPRMILENRLAVVTSEA
jgi:glutamate formiminotransferase/glutamate formiminotransferase/formiminotetrahydrofolate cyclodeaminase